MIEAEAEEGIASAQAWAERELGMNMHGNPDVIVLRYGLFSVADSRRVCELSTTAPFTDEHKVVIIAANRAYHEAQNALLKLFEEPPPRTYLFLVLPSLGGLLQTLRSRVQVLSPYQDVVRSTSDVGRTTSHTSNIPKATAEFLKASKEKRSALIKKLTSGKDEEEKRENREEAIALLNGIEAVAYEKLKHGGETAALLSDIAILRGHLYDRSAPVRMILEHLSIVLPRELGKQ